MAKQDQGSGTRTRGNGLTFQQGRCRLDIRNEFLMERIFKHWHRAVVGFKRRAEVALEDMG